MKLTKAPVLVHPVQPQFPAGEERGATVVLAITIGVDGAVEDASVLQSGGPRFDAATLAAARQLVFTPAEVNGRPDRREDSLRVHVLAACARADADSDPLRPRRVTPTLDADPYADPRPPPRPKSWSTDIRASATSPTRPSPPPRRARWSARRETPSRSSRTSPASPAPPSAPASSSSGAPPPPRRSTYVDGVPIPTLFHGSALRSTVNGDLVRDVTLTPGAYGADYGSAIGGMVRVETKELPESGVHGYVGADTLDGSGMVSAALGDRVRVAVAGRYGWLDSVLRAVDAPNVDQFFAIPRYSDYQAKIQIALRKGESLDAVFLGSGDDLSQIIPDADPAHAAQRDDEHVLPAFLPALPSRARRRIERRRHPVHRPRHVQPAGELRREPGRARRIACGAGGCARRTARSSPTR